jgi:hypothetical protein
MQKIFYYGLLTVLIFSTSIYAGAKSQVKNIVYSEKISFSNKPKISVLYEKLKSLKSLDNSVIINTEIDFSTVTFPLSLEITTDSTLQSLQQYFLDTLTSSTDSISKLKNFENSLAEKDNNIFDSYDANGDISSSVEKKIGYLEDMINISRALNENNFKLINDNNFPINFIQIVSKNK